MSSAVESEVRMPGVFVCLRTNTLCPPAQAIVVLHVNVLILYVLSALDIISINSVQLGRHPSMITTTRLAELVASIVIYRV